MAKFIPKDQLQRVTANMTNEQKVAAVRKLIDQGYEIEGIAATKAAPQVEAKPQPRPISELMTGAFKQVGGPVAAIATAVEKAPEVIEKGKKVVENVTGSQQWKDAVKKDKARDILTNKDRSFGDTLLESIPFAGQGFQAARQTSQLNQLMNDEEVTGGIGTNIQDQAVEGAKTAGSGLLDMTSMVSSVGQMGLNAATKPLRSLMQGGEAKDVPISAVNLEKGFYNTNSEEASKLGVRGLQKLVNGGFQVASSPVGGVIQEGVEALPKPAQQGLAWLLKQPGEIIRSTAKSINPNLTDEQIDQDVIGPLQAAASLAGMKKIKGKVVNEAEKGFEKSAKIASKLGFEEGDLSQIKNLPPELQSTAKSYLEAAKRKLASPRNESGAFAQAGKDLEAIIDRADEVLKSKGKEIGDLRKNSLGNKIIKSASEQKNAYQKFLKEELNVKFKQKSMASELLDAAKGKGKSSGVDLDFSNSRIAGNSAAIKKFQDIFELLKKKNLNARDVEARTGQINELTGLLKESGFRGSEANTMLNKAKQIIDDAVGTVDADFKGKKIDFAGLAKELKRLKKAAKAGTGDLAISSGEQVLRRFLGNTGAKYEKAIQSAEKIAKKLGIKEGSMIREKAALADLIEHYTQSYNPQSLQGNLSKFGQNLLEKVPVVGKPASAAADVIGGAVRAKQAKSALSNLIESAPMGKVANVAKAKFNKTGIAMVLSQLLANSMPKTQEQTTTSR